MEQVFLMISIVYLSFIAYNMCFLRYILCQANRKLASKQIINKYQITDQFQLNTYQVNSIFKMSQQNSILKSTLQTLYHDYTKQLLQQKLASHVDRQVLNDIVEGLFITSKQSFLTNIIENIRVVKKQNEYLKNQLAKEQQDYYQKIGMISSRIRKEYQQNILTQKQTLCQILAIAQELIGQRDIIVGIKNILNQNRMQRQSLLYRQQFIQKLHLQIKQAKNAEVKLMRQIQQERKNLYDKQIGFEALQTQFIQKHKQLEAAQQRIAQNTKDCCQLNSKLCLLRAEIQNKCAIIQQLKQQVKSLNENKLVMIENEQFLNKRVQYLKQENQLLRQKIEEARLKLETIASNHQANTFQKEHQKEIIRQLQINIHLTKQSSRQEICKYQTLLDEQNKKYLQQNRLLKQQNEQLRDKCENLIEKKGQLGKMVIDIRQKYMCDAKLRQQQYQKQAEQYKNELQQMSRVIFELKQDVSTKGQLVLEYQRNLLQIAALKQQIQYLTKPGRLLVGVKSNRNVRVLPCDMQNNIYYLLSLLREQARQLKRQNEFLKTSFNKQVKFLYQSSQKLISEFFVKMFEAKQECQYCQHYKQLFLNKKTLIAPKNNLNQNIPNVTHIGSSKQVNTSNKKRLLDSVKDLARKYEVIEQQNRYFTNQIQRFCK